MEQRPSSKSSDIGSTRGKEVKKLSAVDTKFLYLPTNEQTSLVVKSKREGTSHPHNEQNRQQLEQTIDVKTKKEFLAQKGKQLYEKIQKDYSCLDKGEIEKIRNNYERRYDTRVTTLFEEAPYYKDSTEVLPSAFTVETRVKGYPRVCYRNSINLEKGIIWADGNYKSRRDKLPLIKRILSLQDGVNKIEKVNKILEAAEEQKLLERNEGAKILKTAIERCKLAIKMKNSKDIIESAREIIKLAQEKEAREKERAKEGKYDNEAEPFEIDGAGKKVQVQGTKPSFNSDVIGYQIGLLMKEKNIAPENFVLTKFHSLDIVNTDSVDVINLCVAKNSTKIFQKNNDEFFALLTAPNIKRTLIMATQHFSNVELSKIEVERKDSDTKIHRFTCYFDQKDSRVEPQ